MNVYDLLTSFYTIAILFGIVILLAALPTLIDKKINKGSSKKK